MAGSHRPSHSREPREQVGNGNSGSNAKGKLKVIGKEFPDIETDEQFEANWKITKAKEESLLLDFHDTLSKAELLQPEHDKYYIRRFLRARQHDLEKAKHMYADHVKWRREFDVGGIVKDFKFHERDLFLTLYPQGYHKTDKLGRPIYIQHLGAINIKRLNEITNEDRMLKFHVQEYERCMNYIMPACSKTVGRHIEQTFAIIDVTGVGMSHISGQVKGLLSKITSVDQGNYPEMMGKTFIINAPGMFKLVWGIVRRFLDPRTLTKIELVGTNYQHHLLKYVEKENLPEYLGGTSKATLLDDVGPWQQQNLIDEINADYRAALSDGQPKDLDAVPSQGPARTEQEPRPSTAQDGPLPSQLPASLSSQNRRPSLQESPMQSPSASQTIHESGARLGRSISIASEDDGYYSPRSDSTFASFSERSQNLDDSASGRLQLDGYDSARLASSSKQASLAARVRRIELAIPGLRDKLAPDADLRLERGSFSRSTTGHNILGRVEVLEDAVSVLVAAQETKIEQPQAVSVSPSQIEAEQSKQSCGCCSIM